MPRLPGGLLTHVWLLQGAWRLRILTVLVRAWVRMIRKLSLCFATLLACGDDGSTDLPDASSGHRDAGGNAMFVLGMDAGRDASANGTRLEAGPVQTSMSKRDACRNYVERLCLRHLRCTNEAAYDKCQPVKDRCPDQMFASGSTRTAAQLDACAAEWDQISCTDLAWGKQTSCAIPGTRAVGQSCSFSAQCVTTLCTGSATSCGMCIARIPRGSTCTIPGSCELGLACSAGVCADPETKVATGPAWAGEECGNGLYCVDHYRCMDDTSSSTGKRCLSAPAGTPCGYDDCPLDMYCPRTIDKTCTPLPGLDQPCADSGGKSGSAVCAQGLWCGDGSKCVPRLTLGSRCPRDVCLEELSCLERDSQGSGTCVRVREEGQSCSDVNERCARGTTCTSGVCRAVESLGFFEDACKP